MQNNTNNFSTLRPGSQQTDTVRLIFLIILFGVGYLLYHLYLKKLLKQGPKGYIKPALLVLFAIVLIAVATGRANAIFALIGGLIAAAWRMAPLLVRFYPQIRQILGQFGFRPGGSTGSSRVSTATLEMTLDHQTGKIDGEISVAPFTGRMLSSLSVPELKQLYQYCHQNDPEAMRLLDAYINKEHPNLRGEAGAGGSQAPPAEIDGAMTTEDALDILGLNPGATRKEITSAHRKLMSTLHPDKGGSTYLATRVNQAKDRLLAELEQ